MFDVGDRGWAQPIPMEVMDSLWKISKETSPLANGLSEQQPVRKGGAPVDNDLPALGEYRPEMRKEPSRKVLEAAKDGSRERHKSKDSRLESDLVKRVERLMDDRSQKEAYKTQDLISAAIGRFGEAVSVQIEAIRRDVAQLQTRCPEGEASSRSMHLMVPNANDRGSASSRAASPAHEASTGLSASLRSLLEEQRLATEAQISGLVARVNALQKSLTEVATQQELQHIATGKFACTVADFSAADRASSLQALNAQEEAAKERLRKLKRPPKASHGPSPGGRSATTATRTPSSMLSGHSVHDERISAVSSASSTSAATVPHAQSAHSIKRPELMSVEAPLVELLPKERRLGAGGASLYTTVGPLV